MTRILFDIEGNGLLDTVTKLHCICAVDVDTGERRQFGPTEIDQGVQYLSTGDVLIAHNGLRYDFPVLEKLHGFYLPLERKLDTLVLSRLKFPDIKATDGRYNATRLAKGLDPMGALFGSHSIEAWAFRFGVLKAFAEMTDFSEWTPELQERCVSDVACGLLLWKYINPDTYSQAAINLEHRVALLCERITVDGWPFDIPKAGALHATLVAEKERIEKGLVEQFGSWEVVDRVFTPKRNNARLGYKAGVPVTKHKTVTFNPQSRPHIERCLRECGWIPTEFTENGRAKLDEEVLTGLATTFPQAEGLVEYLTVCKRLGQLAEGDQAWLKVVESDGCIHAKYNPMGAVTSRAAHFQPNISQVPSVSNPYGRECRELFGVPPGWEQVGADMSGLELRCFAHYLAKYDGGAYAELVLDGDAHWSNTLAIGFFPPGTARDSHDDLHTLLRTESKRFLYGWLYGAGDLKAGRIILDAVRAAETLNPDAGLYAQFFGRTAVPGEKLLKRVGRGIKESFLARTPGLQDFVGSIHGLVGKHGKLKGLDGRWLPIRSSHSSLNTLLQSAGAILCKQWITDAHDALLLDEGLQWGWDGDVVMLGWIHDEVQVAARNGLGERIGGVLTRCAQKAGEPFGFRVRLDSDYKKGRTWADCH